MKFVAKWICAKENLGDVCPVFRKTWNTEKTIKKAELYITAHGVYEAVLNGRRVGGFVMAPGWTSYEKRLQYQNYDITKLLQKKTNFW